MNALTVECMTSLAAWDALEGVWHSITQNNPMRCWEWQRAWWSGFHENRQLRILVARDGAEVRGILPLALESRWVVGSQLIFIGSSKACSDDLSALVAQEDIPAVASAFAQWLIADSHHGNWDRINWDGVSPEDRFMRVLRSKLQEQGVSFVEKPSPHCWAIALPPTFDAYLAGLSKRARKMLKDLDRDYMKTDRVVRRTAANIEQAIEFLQQIEDLHQRRWQESGVVGCFANRSFKTFLNDAATRMAGEFGVMEISLLELDGKPIAGGVGLTNKQEYLLYLVGMDTSNSELRPGWMLNLELIRDAIARGFTKFNFLRGDEAYKERLGAVPTPQLRLVGTPPRFIPRVRDYAYNSGLSLSRWWQGSATSSLTPTQ